MSLSLSVPLSMCLNQHAFSNQQLPSMLANEVVDFEMTNCINLWCWQIFHSVPYAHLCTETRLFKILKDCTRCEHKNNLLSDLYSEYINVEVHAFNPLMCNTQNHKQVVSKSINLSLAIFYLKYDVHIFLIMAASLSKNFLLISIN